MDVVKIQAVTATIRSPNGWQDPIKSIGRSISDLRSLLRFEKPVIIVSAPRAGSTLLFELLSQSQDAWTIAGESQAVIERIPEFHPRTHGFDSNRLTDKDANDANVVRLLAGFWSDLRDRDGQALREASPPAHLVFIEKTPKNALRIPFLNAIFPDARFIFLFRDPRANIGSLIDGWVSGKFVTYPALPQWQGPRWSFLLTPGWRDLIGAPLASIAAAQWEQANRHIMDDLAHLPRNRWHVVQYEALIADPSRVVQRLCDFAGLAFDTRLKSVVSGSLPLSTKTLTAPSPTKWSKHESEILPLLPKLEKTHTRLLEFTSDL